MSILHNLNASIFLCAREEWANLLHMLARVIVKNLYQNYFFPPEIKVTRMIVIRIYIIRQSLDSRQAAFWTFVLLEF